MSTVKQVRNTAPMIAARRRIALEGRVAKARAVLEELGYRVIEPPEGEPVKAHASSNA